MNLLSRSLVVLAAMTGALIPIGVIAPKFVCQ